MPDLNMGDTSQLLALIENHFGGIFRLNGQIEGVEIGVHRGQTSKLLLETFDRLHLVMIDPWATYDDDHPYRQSGDGCSRFTAIQQESHHRQAFQVHLEYRFRSLLCRATSERAATIFSKPNEFDFVFIDGDHTYEAVRQDIKLWFPMVRPGGLLLGHDYGHPRDRRGIWGVKQAVDEFAVKLSKPLQTFGSVWKIEK